MVRKKRRLVVVMAVFLAMMVSGGALSASYAAGDYDYEYKYVYGKWKDVTTQTMMVAKQPAGGTRFTSGKGGFYYSPKGGKSYTVSVAFGGQFGNIGVGINSGQQASTGAYIEIPGKKSYIKKHYYKLMVKKNFKARPVKLYRRHKSSRDKWQYVSKTVRIKGVSYDLIVKQVK